MRGRRVEQPRARGWLLGTGLALAACGLGILGYVGWQLWGTTWVAQREHRQITDALEQEWATRPVADLRPGRVPTGDASALVRIPRFGRAYVVPVLEGATAEILTRGYGHVTGSADPGEVGNYALAAHRVTHGEPLRRMPELRPGDEVVVESVEATHTYVLDTDPRRLVVPFTGTWVLDPLPDNPGPGPEPVQRPGQRLITLTTCSELFRTDDRMVAFGHLVRSRPRDR